MQIINITDLNREEIKPYVKLTEAQLRCRLESEKGMFIAESPKVIKIALECGYEPVSYLMEEKHIEGQAKEILSMSGDVPVYTASREILADITGYELTRGILCAMKRPLLPSAKEVVKGASRIAVIENVVDSTNIGAIVRSAAALGIDAILFTPSCSDPFIRRSVRVSMGTIFLLPFTYIGSSAEEWKEHGIDLLHELGFKTCAMALTDNSISIDDKRLQSEDKLAIILGTEGTGLIENTVRNSDYTVKIPMYHNVDSLNVAAASAVAFWELRKR